MFLSIFNFLKKLNPQKEKKITKVDKISIQGKTNQIHSLPNINGIKIVILHKKTKLLNNQIIKAFLFLNWL